MWVYSHFACVCNQTMTIKQALDFLKENGDFSYDACTDNELPMNCRKDTCDLKLIGFEYRIKDFDPILNKDDNPHIKIIKIKQQIELNHVVIVGLKVDDNFRRLDITDNIWKPKLDETNSLCGHALCIVGYDDATQQFELMNSFGKEWRNHGYCFINYEDFVAVLREAYTIETYGSQAIANTYDISILSSANGELVPTVKKQGVYSVQIGQSENFRLKFNNLEKPIYVFPGEITVFHDERCHKGWRKTSIFGKVKNRASLFPF